MTWTIPGYVADSIVGHGASGEVWRGRCTVDGEVVALKRLPVDDAESLRNAQAEAAVLASFDHPHILRMRELLISEGEAILVTDFAHGGSLAEVLAHRGRLSAGEVVTIVAPIAAALAHAHAEGVVHGDVSASNILFTAAGLPLLADLGVARIVGQADGGTRATPLYVDPLVARGGVSGPHSDVFSLAAVAWHALTGAPPWLGESVAESLWLAADGDLPPIATAVPTIPPGLAAALDRALQDDGLLRGSAAELALDARHAVEPIPVDGWTARPAAARSRARHSAVEAPVPPPGLRAALLPARRGAVEPAAAVESASAVAALPATSVSGRPPFRRAEPPPLVSPSARTRSARPRERHDAGPA
ncbi:MAG: serine/threonine protein kinase, partial [Pseudonocardiales bacterium]|nr:serine/threonine protein kinase [Pseudonocardiales bacterium]